MHFYHPLLDNAGFIQPNMLTGTTERPEKKILEGSTVTLVPLSAREHGDDLWAGTGGAENDALWRYLFEGPFLSREPFDHHLHEKEASADPLYYAILDARSLRALGHAALMRIEPKHRVIEVGSILYTPVLQRTRGATEAMYLLARYVFEELKYRRYEWKCNALNDPSRSAALRLGFKFEGVFRQHMIAKGENRDTAWFSMLDCEWPQRKVEFQRWLSAANFNENGQQRSRLQMLNHH